MSKNNAITEITLSALAEMLGGILEAPGDTVIRGAGALSSAGPEEITFLANARYVNQMASNNAAAVIVSNDYEGPGDKLLRCEDAYFAFRQTMVHLYGFRKCHFEGIDPSASVDATALIGENVRISSNVHVAPDCDIGDGVILYPGVYVGPGCKIGSETIIHPNVTIYENCILGSRVIIHAGCNIGQDSFGYATHNGVHEKIPHSGRVIIEDDVEMASGCTIDRAAMGETVIGAGTKLSDQVVVAHGVTLGKGCLIVAGTGIGGSVTIGNYCVLAGHVGVVGHITLGDGVQVGAKSLVTNDVPAGTKVWGNPAIPLATARRSAVYVSKLPKFRDTISKIKKDLTSIQKFLKLGGDKDISSDTDKDS